MGMWQNLFKNFGRSQLLDIVIQGNSGSPIYPDTKAAYFTDTYSSNVDVFSVIDKIVNPASRIPVFQVDKKTLKEKPGYATELLKKPNPFESTQDFVTHSLITFKIFGECFIACEKPEFGLRAGRPVRLDNLPPQWVELKIGDFMEPIKGYELYLGAGLVNYPFDQVMFWKTFNPNFQIDGSHLRGMSPLRPLLRAVCASSAGYDSMVSSFQNQGAYGILTILGERVETNKWINKVTSKEQLSQLEESFSRKMTGTKNRGKIFATNKDVQWTPFGLDPKEMELLKSITFTGGALYDAYGVPDILKSGSQSKTYLNYQEAQKALWNNTIIPTVDAFYQKLSAWLMPLCGEDDTMFLPDYDDVPILQEDKKASVEWMIKAGLTPNEIREALGYDSLPYENMDVPLVSAGMTRIDEIGMMPDVDLTEEALKALPDYRRNGESKKEKVNLN